eukprot:gene11652-4891_t
MTYFQLTFHLILFFLLVINIKGDEPTNSDFTLVPLNTSVAGTCEWKFENRMEILQCDLNNGWSGPISAAGSPLEYVIYNKQCGDLTGTTDKMGFFYTPRSGNGSIVGKVNRWHNGLVNHFGFMVRESANSNARMLFFGLPNIYGYTGYTNNYQPRIFYRETTGANQQNVLLDDKMLDGIYFAYTKIERQGDTINVYVSDDTFLWVLYYSHTFTATLPASLIYGFGSNAKQGNNYHATFSEIYTEGFACGTGSRCGYTDYRTNCFQSPTLQSCGANQWYKRIASNHGDDQLYGYIPTFTTAVDKITLSSKLHNDLSQDRAGDIYILALKEVSGDGSISAEIDEFLNIGAFETPYAGVIIRKDMKNINEKAPDAFYCYVPSKRKVEMRYRPSEAGGFTSKYIQDESGIIPNYIVTPVNNKFTVKITKIGSNFTCSFRTTNSPTWINVGTRSIPSITGTFYAGLVQDSVETQVISTVFKNVNYDGFSGFCGNHGDCQTVGGSLDKCACRTGWTGDQCQYPICFGKNSTDPTVCNSRGNCTAPDFCECEAPNTHLHNACESYLYNFKLHVCDETQGCTLNDTAWSLCVFEKGPTCYCSSTDTNLITQDKKVKISCDGQNHITSISIVGAGLKSVLPDFMMNFTALESLDLSYNAIKSTRLLSSTFLPTFKSLNLSYNNINNLGEYYNPSTAYFLNFKLVMDGNAACGIYPESWIPNKIDLGIKNHNTTLWCSSFGNTCSLLKLIDDYIMFPSETTVLINYTSNSVSECQNYPFSKSNQLLCESRNATTVNRMNSIYKSLAPSQKYIECPKSQIVPDEFQKINLVWKYNSTLFELISTTVDVINLRFINFLSHDRHLIYSNNTGDFVDVYLTLDQNITRYKKHSSDSTYFYVMNDNYFGNINIFSIDGKNIKCSVKLNEPNTGKKSIDLYDNSKSSKLNSISFSFWLVKPKDPIVDFLAATSTILYDTNGNLIPGVDGYNYQLNNTSFDLNYTCNSVSGKIQNCIKHSGTYTRDIVVVPLDFTHGGVYVTTINALFYKKTTVQSVVPKALSVNKTGDIFISLKISTFDTSLTGVQYLCIVETTTVVGVLSNSTTIKCPAIQFHQVKTTQIEIQIVYENFKGVILSAPFHIHGENTIYPSMRTISQGGYLQYLFSYIDLLPSFLYDSLECQLSDGSFYRVDILSSYEFQCNITIIRNTNLTFWFKNIYGSRERLSSNSIFLTVHNIPLKFHSESQQLGNTMVNYRYIVDFNRSTIPTGSYKDISCAVDGETVDTIYKTADVYNCSISSVNGGFKNISMLLRIYQFKVPNYHNTFKYKYEYEFITTNTSHRKAVIPFNGNVLIAAGIMRPDCKDILVTYRGKEIPRVVKNCVSTTSTLEFLLEDNYIGKHTNYTVYTGNSIAIANETIIDISGIIKVDQFSGIESKETIQINQNNLEFGFLKLFNIFSVNPFAALGKTSNVTITSNYEVIDYKNKIEFKMKYNGNSFLAHWNGKKFEATLTTLNQGVHNISMIVVYKPTNDIIQASINQVEFIFMDPVSNAGLFPHVYQFETSSFFKQVGIYTNQNLLTDRGLMCRYRHSDQIKYATATFFQNSNSVKCAIKLDLNSNVEFVNFDLYMNTSSDSNFHFILSTNNFTLPFIKSPIEIILPTTISKNQFGKGFDLNFTNPFYLNDGSTLSISNYKLKVIPENIEFSKYIDCSLKNLKPNCSFNNFIVDRTPSKLNFQVEFYSILSFSPINITTSVHYFRDNVTFNSESPFITDNLFNTTLKIDFHVSQNLNQNYSFNCQMTGKIYPISKGIADNLFSCFVQFSEFDTTLPIGLYLNNSLIEGLDGIISNENSNIEVLQLKYVPEQSQNTMNTNLVVSRNDSSTYSVPTKYRNLEYRLVSRDSFSFTFSCSAVSGTINCQKTPVSIAFYDLLRLYFRLEYKPTEGTNWKELTVVRKALISYEKNPILSISPLVGKVNAPLNVTITFNSRNLKTDPDLLKTIGFYCSDNVTNAEFIATKSSDSTLICLITYDSVNTLSLQTFFRTTEAANQNVSLNSNTYPFYFLVPGEIEFSTIDHARFFLTSAYVSININITTFIPSSVEGFIKAKLNDASGYAETRLDSKIGNNHVFISNVSTSSPGIKSLTLWFNDGNHEFQLSNNSLSIIFGKASTIVGIGPSVAIINQTNLMTIQTLVDTAIDYGNSSFICKYGFNETKESTAVEATFDTKGQFFCNLYSSKEGIQFVSVWLKAFGVEKKMTTNEVSIRFVSSNYLTPSYGLASGGESVSILKYEGPESNITFLEPAFRHYVFVCKLNGTNRLDCLTPKVDSNFPIFSSNELIFYSTNVTTNKSLSLPFIFYETRKIEHFTPQIISSSTPDFDILINFNQSLVPKEGSFYLTIAYKLQQEERYNLGLLNNALNKTVKVNSLIPGIWKMNLFYFNLGSVEFKSMFSVSPEVDIYFLGFTTMKFKSNSKNIVPLYERRNLTVSINDLGLIPSQQPNIKCKLGENYVDTYFDKSNPLDYTCLVDSSVPKTEFISLWYKDSLTYNGEFLVSSKSLPVFFIEMINITFVAPFSSIKNSENVSIISTLDNDIYGSNAQYLCVFNGLSSTATLLNTKFYCNLPKGGIVPVMDYVQINITSKDTGHSIALSDNHIEFSKFYFLNPIQSSSMYPFVLTYPKQQLSMKNQQIQLILDNELLLEREVYCQFTSSDGINYSKVHYVGGNKKIVTCMIQKEKLENVVEIVNVVLWLNASGSSFVVSSNNESHLFIKESFEWKNSLKLLNLEQTKPIELNVSIPQNLFNYQLQMTPNLIENVTTNVVCDIATGNPVCIVPNYALNSIKSVPAYLEFQYNIIHKVSGLVASVTVDKLVFYKQIDIQSVKPFIFSHYERIHSPFRSVLNILNMNLNSKVFNFKCNVSSNSVTQILDAEFDISSVEYQNGIAKDSQFSCLFNAFGETNSNYNLRLMFVSDMGNIELTSKSAVIHSTDSMTMNPIQAPASSVFNITIYLNQNYFSIFYPQFEYELKLFIAGSTQKIANCSYQNSSFNCFVDSAVSLIYPNWRTSKKVRTDLFIGNMRALSLTPFFTFYPDIEIKDIQPTNRIIKLAKGTFYFTLSNFEFLGTTVKVRYSLNEEVLNDNCTLIESNEVNCPFPSFNSTGDAKIEFSLNDNIFQTIKNSKIIVYDYVPMRIHSASLNALSYLNQTMVNVFGENFIDSPSILVKIFDSFLERQFKGYFVNSSHIQVTIDPFYEFKIIKRSLNIQISFDSGEKFIESSVYFSLKKWKNIKLNPSMISADAITSGIQIQHFPTSGLYFNQSDSSIEFYLTLNSTYNIKLACSSKNEELICNSTSKPIEVGYYEFKMVLLNKEGSHPIYLPAETTMYVYSNITMDLSQPKIYDMTSRKPIVFKSNLNPKIFKKVFFRYIWSPALFVSETNIDIVTGNIQNNEVSVITPERNGTFTLSFSLNGLNFHTVGAFDSIITSKVDSVSNSLTNFPYFYSFQESFGKIEGSQFRNSPKDFRIVLYTGYEDIDITQVSLYNFTSSSRIDFRFPTIDQLNVSYALRLPLDLNLGVSFNGGFDFQLSKISYLSTFLQPTFTGILPRLAPVVDLNLTLYGAQMELASTCGFYSPTTSNLIYKTNITTTTTEQANAVRCFIPRKFITEKELLVTIFNSQNDRNSKSYSIIFYEPPILTALQPDVGVSPGGFPLTIFTENVTFYTDEVYCKLGNILCDKPCQMSSSSITCTTPSHPSGSVDVEISFNKLHWHGMASNKTQFSYTACIAGYTSATYRENCNLCPPGTYKPVKGLFDCIPCDVNEYNEFSGSLKCEKCPTNTTTNGKKGSSSFSQCICDVGYYLNPEYVEHSNAHKKCIICPTGSYCPSTNTTTPFVEYGFWRSDDISRTYYRCLPEKSCGGVKSDNCTSGYAGPRCGFCASGYYRFRRDCNKCEEGAWLRLVAAINGKFLSIWFEIVYFAPPSESSDEEYDEEFQEKKKKKNIVIVFFKKTGRFLLDTLSEHINMFGDIDVPWDVVYHYTPLNFKTDSESAEDGYTHMNQIFSDLLSFQRVRKNLFSFEKRGLRTSKQIIRRYRNLSKKKSMREEKEEKIVVNEDDVRKFEKKFKDAFQNKSFRKLSETFSERSNSPVSTVGSPIISRQDSKVKLVGSKKIEMKTGMDRVRKPFGEDEIEEKSNQKKQQ